MAIRNSFTVDPEDNDAVVAWTAQHLSLLNALDAAHRRAATLDAILTSTATAAADQEEAASHTALTQAQAATATAQAQLDAATAEARRFEANDLAEATTAADAATAAVSQALAALLRDSAVSRAVTAAVDGLALRERYRTALASTPPAW